MKPIVIIDYGMANLRSVQKAFEKLGHAAQITGDPNAVVAADKVVLPGVGAFQDAIGRLRETGLDKAICRHIRAGRQFLGICLGFQMLFTRSFEDGEHRGLNLFAGDVVRFPESAGLKVPHMGWNALQVRQPAPHLAGLAPDPAVYFVHSYCVVPRDSALIATQTDYGGLFTSAIWSDNVFACQFHPEKSQRVGLQILHNFAALG
jgi:imidazole glycerol-phosphate synthase subunit HisH